MLIALGKETCVSKMKRVLEILVEAHRLKTSECDEEIIIIIVWTVSGWICRYILPSKILTQVNPFQELTHCCMNTWLEISNRLKCQWSVVKLLLLQVMSHGQSTVNRGFSVNKEVAVENFSDRLFIAQRIIHGHIESVGGLVNWHIWKQLLMSSVGAWQKYISYLEEQKS